MCVYSKYLSIYIFIYLSIFYICIWETTKFLLPRIRSKFKTNMAKKEIHLCMCILKSVCFWVVYIIRFHTIYIFGILRCKCFYPIRIYYLYNSHSVDFSSYSLNVYERNSNYRHYHHPPLPPNTTNNNTFALYINVYVSLCICIFAYFVYLCLVTHSIQNFSFTIITHSLFLSSFHSSLQLFPSVLFPLIFRNIFSFLR